MIETAEVIGIVDSALNTPNFAEGEWPAYNWWTLFEDSQLSEMMEEAIANNPDLMAAISRVRASQEEAKKVRSALLPQADLDFKYDYQHLSKDSLDRFPPSALPAVVKQIFLTLNFEYEIDLFGKNRNRYRAAIGEARAQAAEMAQSFLMITTALAETYFNYAANLQSFQMSRDITAAQKALLELTDLRRENGLDDQIDVDQAMATLLTAEGSVVMLENELDLNITQLNILMGKGPEERKDFHPPVAEFDRPFPLPDNIPLNLLAREKCALPFFLKQT